MSYEEAEKATDRELWDIAQSVYEPGGRSTFPTRDDPDIEANRAVYDAGRDDANASRDAEVAALRERVAELEAVIDAIDAIEPEPIDTWGTMQFTARQTNDIGNILAASPSTVLAAVKRETAAQALEDAADDPRMRLSGHSGVSITRLRERAAALGSGTEGSD